MSDDLERRDAQLEKKLAVSPIQKTVDALVKAGQEQEKSIRRNRRHTRITIILVVFDLLASILLFGVARHASRASQEAKVASRDATVLAKLVRDTSQSLHDGCEVGNQFRKDSVKLWAFVTSLSQGHPDPTLTPAERVQRTQDITKLRDFLAKTYRLRKCPPPPPPLVLDEEGALATSSPGR